MAEYPTVTIAHDLARGLDAATDKIKLCEQQLFLIDVAVHHRRTLSIDINALAGPLRILYNMLNEATQQLERVNDPINRTRIETASRD